MKYKFCSIRINVTKHDVTFVTREGGSNSLSPWLRHWARVLGSVVIQLYAGECTPSVDRALILLAPIYTTIIQNEIKTIFIEDA